MLALVRKRSQEIVISDEIVLKVVAIGSDRVRIALQVPDTVRVRRMEQPEVSAPVAPLVSSDESSDAKDGWSGGSSFEYERRPHVSPGRRPESR